MRNILKNVTSSRYRIMWHIIFWLAYWLSFAIFYGSATGQYKETFIELLISLPVKALFTYTILYYLMPKFLLTRKNGLFFGLLIISCIFFGLLQRAVYSIQVVQDLCLDNSSLAFTPVTVVKSLISMYIVAALAIMIKLIKHIYKSEKAQQELAQQKLEAELKFLKSQIHPHFLFNTLNNLYALTLKNSPKAPEVVLKLSDLLDYMLYECNSNSIPIEKEIDLIDNYLSLEKLRYGERLDASFNYSVEDMTQDIAPMLILPFVENSFKHGVSLNTEVNYIAIDLTVKHGIMVLKVENSKPNGVPPKTKKNPLHEGIGLNNVNRRLNLLYKEEFELQIFDEEDSFLIVLKLELKKIKTNIQQLKTVSF
jgi:two-component system, LytTR family, sensor kinase